MCKNCGDIAPAQDENGVYLIGTPEEMLWFAKTVNSGETEISGKLTADIALSEYADSSTKVNWPGIGTNLNPFKGTFDGQGYTVTFENTTWGLFGYAMGAWNTSNYSGTKYVVVKNVIIDGNTKNTPLIHCAGYIKITDCINKADVIGKNSYVAGILGSGKYALQYNSIKYNDIAIENCINEGNINGKNNVGGILGESVAGTKLNACANIGDVSGESNVGGLVGYMQEGRGTCEVKNSYNCGKVTGSSATAGIIGNMYNGVDIIKCYNAGEATYAIAGNIYNDTAKIMDTYYRGDLCTYSVPNDMQSGGYYPNDRGIAMTSAEMSGEEVAAALGEAFKQSCPSPVLATQKAKGHTIENNICVVCKDGNNMPTEYKVTFVESEGAEIIGDTTFRAGSEAYTFSVNVKDGYYKEEAFAVCVNGKAMEAVEGTYTVENPSGPFYITVTGVKQYEGVLPIVLPADGNGYRINPCDGYGVTVESGKDYKFTVSFVEGFKAGESFTVKVNEVPVEADNEGVYTIENILLKQTISVEGVDIIPSENTVDVKVDITSGDYEFMVSKETEDIMMGKEMEVPYFDLELYDLERYYYNPYCYLDEEGNIRGQQKVGTRESAYGVVTTMHAFIYMTEIFYLGYDVEDAGTGSSHMQDSDGDGESDFNEAVSWTQGVGSSFMNLWGAGSNLNYHLNYEYPIAYPGWGSTSDQQALKDGDRISVHFITGGANGSAYGLFVVNDTNDSYETTDVKDCVTVKQGECVKLTHYLASQGDNYTTAFVKVPNKDLYWVEEGAESHDIREWNREDGFGNLGAEAFKTDENGVITIDTTDIEPGTYYLGTAGGFEKGNGQAGSDGFVSNGAEAGPSYFKLIVEESGEQECKHDKEVVVKGKAATCTEDGLTDGKKCETCGTVTEEQQLIKANGHKEVVVKGKAATCTKTGLTEGKKCSVCGEVTVAQKTIKAKGHSYSTKYTVDKKATAKANGSKSKHCTRCDAKTSVKTIYKASGVKLSTTSYIYNGKTKSPSVVIKDSKGNKISSDNYKLAKPSGRKKVGKYTYKITFKNEYSGTKSLILTIKPKSTSIKSLSKAKKAFTVKWKKQSSQTTGYQIMYSTSKSFKEKYTDTKTISKKNTTKTTIKKLKAKKTYYVKVRTYKKVKINGKNVKVYSSWSKVKKIKTK